MKANKFLYFVLLGQLKTSDGLKMGSGPIVDHPWPKGF
jgi:hypothetical protein